MSEFDEFKAMTLNERLEYFVTFTTRASQVWALANDEGWRTMQADDRIALPVWPKQAIAAAGAAEGEEARAISMQDFTEKWLPGMVTDGTQVAIFPLGDEGIVVDAGELLEELEEELEDLD